MKIKYVEDKKLNFEDLNVGDAFIFKGYVENNIAWKGYQHFMILKRVDLEVNVI